MSPPCIVWHRAPSLPQGRPFLPKFLSAINDKESCLLMAGLPEPTGNQLKPVAAISDPPTHIDNRNRCAQRPPERQHHVSAQPQDGENPPEDFFLHSPILRLRSSLATLVLRPKFLVRATSRPTCTRSVRGRFRFQIAAALSLKSQISNLQSTLPLARTVRIPVSSVDPQDSRHSPHRSLALVDCCAMLDAESCQMTGRSNLCGGGQTFAGSLVTEPLPSIVLRAASRRRRTKG
jgi:hypothetical protein